MVWTFFFRLSSKEKGRGEGGGIYFSLAFEIPSLAGHWLPQAIHCSSFLENVLSRSKAPLLAFPRRGKCILKVNYSVHLGRWVEFWSGNWTNMSKHTPKSPCRFELNKTNLLLVKLIYIQHMGRSAMQHTQCLCTSRKHRVCCSLSENLSYT